MPSGPFEVPGSVPYASRTVSLEPERIAARLTGRLGLVPDQKKVPASGTPARPTPLRDFRPVEWVFMPDEAADHEPEGVSETAGFRH